MEMNDELKQQHSADAELRKLIENAARLTFGEVTNVGTNDKPIYITPAGRFNPLDPERGDLMKVAQAANLAIVFPVQAVYYGDGADWFEFTKGNHPSLTLAILRAASAVLKARSENAE